MNLIRKQTVPEEVVSIDDLFLAHLDEAVLERQGEMSSDKYDIPPFLRLPPIGSRERLEMTLSAIDRRFLWLAERGIRPSSSAIAGREEIVRQLDDLSQSPVKVGAGGTA